MPYIALGVYFFGLNIGLAGGLWPSFIKESIALFSVFLLISSSAIFIPKTKFVLFLAVFFGVAIFNYFFVDVFFHQDLIILILYLMSTLFVYAFFANKENGKYFNAFLVLLALSGLYNVVLQLIQFFFDFSSYNGIILPLQGVRPYGNIGQPNNLGTLLAVCVVLPAFIKKEILLKNKYYIFGLLVYLFFMAVGISLTDSRTALVSLVAMMGWIFFNPRGNGFLTILLFSVFLFVIFIKYVFKINSLDRDLIHDNISSNRFDLWLMMLEASFENPFLGFGFNRVSLAQFEVIESYPAWWYVVSQQSHNLLIDFVIWFGYPFGVFLGFLFVIVFLRRHFSDKEYFCFILLIPFLVHSLLEYPLHYFYILFIFAAILGSLDSKFEKIDVCVVKHGVISLIPLSFLSFFILLEYLNIEKSVELQALSFHYKNKSVELDFYDAKILDSLSAGVKSIGFYKRPPNLEVNEFEYVLKIFPNNMSYDNLIDYYWGNGYYYKSTKWMLKKDYYVVPSDAL